MDRPVVGIRLAVEEERHIGPVVVLVEVRPADRHKLAMVTRSCRLQQG